MTDYISRKSLARRTGEFRGWTYATDGEFPRVAALGLCHMNDHRELLEAIRDLGLPMSNYLRPETVEEALADCIGTPEQVYERALAVIGKIALEAREKRGTNAGGGDSVILLCESDWTDLVRRLATPPRETALTRLLQTPTRWEQKYGVTRPQSGAEYFEPPAGDADHTS